jgi:hypothetical protein
MLNCADAVLLSQHCFNMEAGVAIGQPVLGRDAICGRILRNFRERLYNYTEEHPEGEDLMFGQLKPLLGSFREAMGASAEAQRAGTAMLMSSIKKSGRLSLARDALAMGAKAIPSGLLIDGLRKVLDPKFKNGILCKTKDDQPGGRLSRVLGLCSEALGILEALPEREIRVLRRLLGLGRAVLQGRGRDDPGQARKGNNFPAPPARLRRGGRAPVEGQR